MKKGRPPYPDPKRVKQLSNLIDKYRKNILLTCLTEGITKKDIIEYSTRLCAIKHLDDILNDPCPMKLISEIEDLAEYKRLCVHQQKQVDRIKYGSDYVDIEELYGHGWTQGLT
jgi:hypothetical protein